MDVLRQQSNIMSAVSSFAILTTSVSPAMAIESPRCTESLRSSCEVQENSPVTHVTIPTYVQSSGDLCFLCEVKEIYLRGVRCCTFTCVACHTLNFSTTCKTKSSAVGKNNASLRNGAFSGKLKTRCSLSASPNKSLVLLYTCHVQQHMIFPCVRGAVVLIAERVCTIVKRKQGTHVDGGPAE